VRDADQFDEFYRAQRQRVLRFLYAAGGDLAEAQDATQEAFARAWQHWSRVREYAEPAAWVRTVGWRILAGHWRKLRGARRAYGRHGPPDDAPAPSERTVLLVSALRRLPADQRHAIVLHHLLDLPVTQVAAETGVPEGTVKARLSRGRTALAHLLGSAQLEDDHA
jgi:RNA polymerase sigma-70 factor (sigma-E family)